MRTDQVENNAMTILATLTRRERKIFLNAS
jgi:hypothetical protein